MKEEIKIKEKTNLWDFCIRHPIATFFIVTVFAASTPAIIGAVTGHFEPDEYVKSEIDDIMHPASTEGIPLTAEDCQLNADGQYSEECTEEQIKALLPAECHGQINGEIIHNRLPKKTIDNMRAQLGVCAIFQGNILE